MGSSNPFRLVQAASERTTGLSIAVAGLSLALYAFEARRMSSFQSVANSDLSTVWPQCVAIAAIVALLLVYRIRPRFKLHRHPFVGFGIAVAFTACSSLSANASLIINAPVLQSACHIGSSVCQLLLLTCWAEALALFHARTAGVIVALSFVALGAENAASALLKPDAAALATTLLPLLSTACLYWFKDRSDALDQYPELGGVLGRGGIDCALMPTSASRATIVGLICIYLLPLVCFTFAFGNIHYSWIPHQDGSATSLNIQLAAAIGSALAGVTVLALVTWFWGCRRVQLYSLFVLPIVLVALYLTSIVNGSLSFLYVVPLNIAQKIVFFLVLLAPFLIPAGDGRSPLSAWCIALALYQAGKSASTALSVSADPVLYNMLVVGAISILIVSNMTGLLLARPDERSSQTSKQGTETNEIARKARSGKDPDSQPHEPTGRNDAKKATEATTGNIEDSASRRNEGERHLKDIAITYRLTRREEEILTLLAKGMTAHEIAETLVVSTATAKSHMRNIYAKLNVHTQNELILLVLQR